MRAAARLSVAGCADKAGWWRPPWRASPVACGRAKGRGKGGKGGGGGSQAAESRRGLRGLPVKAGRVRVRASASAQVHIPACGRQKPTARAGAPRSRQQWRLRQNCCPVGNSDRRCDSSSSSRSCRSSSSSSSSSCRLPSLHAAEIAWILGSCLQSRFLPGHTGVQRRKTILGQRLQQSCSRSANIRKYVRNLLPFESRDCLLRVVENGAERTANFLCSREIRHLQSQSETPCRWTHLRWSCFSHLKIGNTDYAFEILCTSLQNKQSTFLNDLTDTMLDVYNLLSLPVHDDYGLELSV